MYNVENMKKAKVTVVHKNCDTGCVFTESGVKLEQFSGWVTGDGRGSTRGLAVGEGCPHPHHLLLNFTARNLPCVNRSLH